MAPARHLRLGLATEPGHPVTQDHSTDQCQPAVQHAHSYPWLTQVTQVT
jgi:hypothetical protein